MTPLPQIPDGGGRFATWAKTVMRCIQERTPQGNHFTRRANGFTFTEEAAAAAAASGAEVKQFRVSQINTSTLIARELAFNGAAQTAAGTLTGNDIEIAKPRHLRAAMWTVGTSTENGWTITAITSTTRTVEKSQAFGGSTATISGTQIVWPAYVEGQTGSVIYAVKLTKEIIGTTLGGGMVEWVDLNADGRHWDFNEQALQLCEEDGSGNTTTKWSLFRIPTPIAV